MGDKAKERLFRDLDSLRDRHPTRRGPWLIRFNTDAEKFGDEYKLPETQRND